MLGLAPGDGADVFVPQSQGIAAQLALLLKSNLELEGSIVA